MRANAIRIVTGVLAIGLSFSARATSDLSNAQPNAVVIGGYCSLLFERASEVKKTFLLQRRNTYTESSEIGNSIELSSEGSRDYLLPSDFASEDISLRLELRAAPPNAEAERTWSLRVFPIFAPSQHKYFGRDVPPDPLLTAPIKGQTEAVVEIAVADDGKINASTVIDGQTFRADDSNALEFKLPFEMEMDFPHENLFVDKESAMYKVDSFLDRLSTKLGRGNDIARTRTTKFTAKVKLQFSVPQGEPEIAVSAKSRD